MMPNNVEVVYLVFDKKGYIYDAIEEKQDTLYKESASELLRDMTGPVYIPEPSHHSSSILTP